VSIAALADLLVTPTDADVPLRAWMRERELLDPANPAHR
jgi:hypothetical protein